MSPKNVISSPFQTPGHRILSTIHRHTLATTAPVLRLQESSLPLFVPPEITALEYVLSRVTARVIDSNKKFLIRVQQNGYVSDEETLKPIPHILRIHIDQYYCHHSLPRTSSAPSLTGSKDVAPDPRVTQPSLPYLYCLPQ